MVRAYPGPKYGPCTPISRRSSTGCLTTRCGKERPRRLTRGCLYNPLRGARRRRANLGLGRLRHRCHLLRLPLPRHAGRKNPDDHYAPRQCVVGRLGRLEPGFDACGSAGLSLVCQPQRDSDGRAEQRQQTAKTWHPTGCGRARAISNLTDGRSRFACRSQAFASGAAAMCGWACCSGGA